MDVLRKGPQRVLAIVLLLQAAAYYAIASRKEIIPIVPPLSSFPSTVNGWTKTAEYPLEKEVQDVLKADDTLNRSYTSSRGSGNAWLFVAYFKTQRYGQAPHSPKNCLPGAGWQPTEDRRFPIAVPGRDAPIVVNRYVIARGDERSFVIYWYQTHSRVIAGEFAAKSWLVADSIRYHRSDTALIRVIVPIHGNDSTEAESTAVAFVQAVYPGLTRHLPL